MHIIVESVYREGDEGNVAAGFLSSILLFVKRGDDPLELSSTKVRSALRQNRKVLHKYTYTHYKVNDITNIRAICSDRSFLLALVIIKSETSTLGVHMKYFSSIASSLCGKLAWSFCFQNNCSLIWNAIYCQEIAVQA